MKTHPRSSAGAVTLRSLRRHLLLAQGGLRRGGALAAILLIGAVIGVIRVAGELAITSLHTARLSTGPGYALTDGRRLSAGLT
jgi:hypothetical protein